MNEVDWFAIVDGKLDGELRRGGEYHADCPWCGKESDRGQTHFSYSTKGGKCFVCGNGGSLRTVAKQIDAMPIVAERRTPAVKRESVAYWKDEADGLLRQFEAHAHRYEEWDAYKPLQQATIDSMRLGVGVLPQSRCRMTRLIVPILKAGVPVWFRGRSIGDADCRCDGEHDCKKWMTSGGVKLADVPLYNVDAVTPGSVVWIVENPVDALMITEQTQYVGVATYSVSYWREEWAASLADAKWVIVAYDNDIPGNGGGPNHAKFAAEWKAAHNGHIMEPNGPKLANRLAAAGLPARLYAWPVSAPNKADIGSVLMRNER